MINLDIKTFNENIEKKVDTLSQSIYHTLIHMKDAPKLSIEEIKTLIGIIENKLGCTIMPDEPERPAILYVEGMSDFVLMFNNTKEDRIKEMADVYGSLVAIYKGTLKISR